jgi:outer membrane protein TolC
MNILKAAALLGAIALGACAAPPTIDSEETIAQAVGAENAIVFRTDAAALDENAVAGRLTRADAVKMSLQHDPGLQASLARVRIALAEAKQIRLLPNPVLSIILRFPEAGGSPIIEAGVTAELLSLIQRPRQISAADHRIRAASAEALKIALDVIAEAEERYVSAQSVDAELSVLADRRKTAEGLLALAKARLAGGEGSRLDVLSFESELAALDVEQMEMESRKRDERLVLARIIGLPTDDANWEIESIGLGEPQKNEKEWIAAALANRPEIHALKWELAAMGDEAALAKYSFLDGAAGLEFEKDGIWSSGFGAEIPLPVFDWGQARQEKAEARILELRHATTLERRKAVEEVRRAWNALTESRRAAKKVQDELIPLQDKRQAQADAQYRNGQADMSAVLLAQQDAQSAKQRLVELQKQAAIAQVKLKRASGGGQ